ncbi:MAG: hypothetical protein Q6370_008965 [Candidatus Sigynarchaeota archaeon]
MKNLGPIGDHVDCDIKAWNLVKEISFLITLFLGASFSLAGVALENISFVVVGIAFMIGCLALSGFYAKRNKPQRQRETPYRQGS